MTRPPHRPSERERERYQEMAAQAIAEAARLNGRLEAIEASNQAKPLGKRTKPALDGAGSGDSGDR